MERHKRNVARRPLRLPTRVVRGSARGFSSAGLSFLKEWGGIGTLIIAVFYTFPFDVFDRFVNTQQRAREAEENAIESVRRSLAEMAALRAEKASRLQQSADARYQNEINGAYDIRIYNLIYTQKEQFRKYADKLRSSELYMIGGSLSLIGEVGDAQYYYDKAISTAQNEEKSRTILTIYREKGNSLFMDTPYRDLEKGRSAYLAALNILAKEQSGYATSMYVVNLSELVAGEILYGDWPCGMSKRPYVNALFEKLGAGNAFVSGYYDLFNSVNSPAREGKGCGYDIPTHSALTQ